MNKLRREVAVVTGASKGIGVAISANQELTRGDNEKGNKINHG